jgi:FMN phosphatase YigB (HAD superfamily)
MPAFVYFDIEGVILLNTSGSYITNTFLLPVLHDMHKKCPLGLLTNLSSQTLKKLQEQNLLTDVKWDVTIDSDSIWYQKPDLQIYAFAQEKASVHAKDILFVDNSFANVQAAAASGWHTFQYDSSQPDISSHQLFQAFLNFN